MGEKKLSKIEEKKKALEQELVRIQDELDESIEDVKEGVSHSLDPKNIIRKYPLPVIGASIVIGFLLGRDSGTTSKKNNRNYEGSRVSSEIKSALARKGISLLLDLVDNKIDEMKKKKQS